MPALQPSKQFNGGKRHYATLSTEEVEDQSGEAIWSACIGSKNGANIWTGIWWHRQCSFHYTPSNGRLSRPQDNTQVPGPPAATDECQSFLTSPKQQQSGTGCHRYNDQRPQPRVPATSPGEVWIPNHRVIKSRNSLEEGRESNCQAEKQMREEVVHPAAHTREYSSNQHS